MDPIPPDRLLGRPPLPLPPIPREPFAGRTVLVTGAGGSIGGPLAARLAETGVARLVLLDRSGRRLARTVRAMGAPGSGTRVRAVEGDAGDDALLDRILAETPPDFVFHAAALKHLPALEGNPLAAFRANVLVTDAVARAAARHGAPRLVHLSTDKAADPSSAMGASKRMAELLLAATPAVSLRLGNVLGSSGSVLVRFRRRLRAGRPLRVTHPEARRFFLATGEAVDLLLHAALAGPGGGILVPDLPPPVRIVDLARRLGAAEGRPAPLVFTGLRPGEKLEERLHGAGERVGPAGAGLLRVIEGEGRPAAAAWIGDLRRCLADGDGAALLALAGEVLPAWRPSDRCRAAAGLAEVPA